MVNSSKFHISIVILVHNCVGFRQLRPMLNMIEVERHRIDQVNIINHDEELIHQGT